MISDSDFYMSENEIKAKALYFLARREYAYKELFTKLCKYTRDKDVIIKTLNQLKEKGYLSEERYIRSYLNSKINKSGILKIKYNLKLKTENTDLIEKVLNENPVNEYDAAKTLWERKFGVVATDKNQLAKQIRFLQNRGFSFDVINKIVK